MGTDKVVIVVKDGMVWEVFGACPYKFDVEILDMDFNGADPDAENAAQDRPLLWKAANGKVHIGRHAAAILRYSALCSQAGAEVCTFL